MNRLLNVTFAGLLLAFTLPLMVMISLAIKLESPGPILCRCDRLTLQGSTVAILKFRTTAHQAQNGRPIGRGGQVTRIGWFLRYTRIEDLPQLINVLRGELTLMADGNDYLDRSETSP